MARISRLDDAISANDLAAVDEVIRGGADVNAAAENFEPPLHRAIEHHEIEIVRRLLVAGAAVNRNSGEGWTPLVHAIDIACDSAWQKYHEINHESTELVELLLAHGARPTARAIKLAGNYESRRILLLLQSYELDG